VLFFIAALQPAFFPIPLDRLPDASLESPLGMEIQLALHFGIVAEPVRLLHLPHLGDRIIKNVLDYCQ